MKNVFFIFFAKKVTVKCFFFTKTEKKLRMWRTYRKIIWRWRRLQLMLNTKTNWVNNNRSILQKQVTNTQSKRKEDSKCKCIVYLKSMYVPSHFRGVIRQGWRTVFAVSLRMWNRILSFRVRQHLKTYSLSMHIYNREVHQNARTVKSTDSCKRVKLKVHPMLSDEKKGAMSPRAAAPTNNDHFSCPNWQIPKHLHSVRGGG